MRKHDPLKREKKSTEINLKETQILFNRQGYKKILIVNKKKGNLAEKRKL